MSTEPVDAVAAYGLAPAGLVPPAQVATPAEWSELRRRVSREGLVGLFATAVARGAWPATDEQAAEAEAMHTAAAITALRIERELLAVSDAFAAARVPFLVLKGPAYAHTVYADPSLRPFGDLDLLVLPEHIEAALRCLQDLGGRRRFAEPRPGFDRRFSKGASVRLPSGWEVDVHRTLVAGPFGLTIDLDRLSARRQSFVVGGRLVHGLAPEERLIAGSYLTMLSHRPPRRIGLRDVAEMAWSNEVDIALVLDLAESWGADAVLALALRTTLETFTLPSNQLSDWADAHHASPRAQKWLRVYTGPGRSSAGQAIAGITAIPGLRNKTAYALALAFPRRSPSTVGTITRWRRAARAVTRFGLT